MPVDPTEPRAIAALRRAFALQRAGLLLALAGTALAFIRWRWAPALPRLAPLIVIALSLGLMALGMIRRVRLVLRPR